MLPLNLECHQIYRNTPRTHTHAFTQTHTHTHTHTNAFTYAHTHTPSVAKRAVCSKEIIYINVNNVFVNFFCESCKVYRIRIKFYILYFASEYF
ncbi:hypothetical protein ANANG_G00170800 [Anguilla anguilla]|uniref:Uncharacterized protein n=1 Tax=Anguilla anguilla TaxID=7936 RepID=A0A9D3M3E2_ANGAN|nr:hypothetical protein ANANG_G00170800 [Anguilla anguilla]